MIKYHNKRRFKMVADVLKRDAHSRSGICRVMRDGANEPALVQSNGFALSISHVETDLPHDAKVDVVKLSVMPAKRDANGATDEYPHMMDAAYAMRVFPEDISDYHFIQFDTKILAALMDSMGEHDGVVNLGVRMDNQRKPLLVVAASGVGLLMPRVLKADDAGWAERCKGLSVPAYRKEGVTV